MARILCGKRIQLHPESGRRSGSGRFAAIGHRYGPDGWSKRVVLFRFDSYIDSALEAARALAVPGTAGMATHGCEDVAEVVKA